MKKILISCLILFLSIGSSSALTIDHLNVLKTFVGKDKPTEPQKYYIIELMKRETNPLHFKYLIILSVAVDEPFATYLPLQTIEWVKYELKKEQSQKEVK